jgi:hypothetical protein
MNALRRMPAHAGCEFPEVRAEPAAVDLALLPLH